MTLSFFGCHNFDLCDGGRGAVDRRLRASRTLVHYDPLLHVALAVGDWNFLPSGETRHRIEGGAPCDRDAVWSNNHNLRDPLVQFLSEQVDLGLQADTHFCTGSFGRLIVIIGLARRGRCCDCLALAMWMIRLRS